MDVIDSIKKHDLRTLQICLTKHQDPNQADDFHNITPLHFAVVYKFPEGIKALLEAGADKNAEMLDGETPLMLAKQMMLQNITEILS